MENKLTEKRIEPGEDLAGAIAVRYAVFVDEQGFAKETETDEIDPTAQHIVLYDAEQPVATGRVFPAEEPGVYLIGRVAVKSTYRGGIGRRVMEGLEQMARERGAVACILSAQCQARGFYEKQGYQAYGEEYLDEHCPHIWMRKELGV